MLVTVIFLHNYVLQTNALMIVFSIYMPWLQFRTLIRSMLMIRDVSTLTFTSKSKGILGKDV